MPGPGRGPSGSTRVLGRVGPGTTAVRRITARLLGWVTVLTAPAWGAGALMQGDDMHPWWNALAVGGIGAAALYITASAVLGVTIRLPAAALGVAHAVAVVTWHSGVADPTATSGRLPWIWLVMPMALAAVATLDSVRLSLGYGILVALAFSAYRPLATGGSAEMSIVVMESLLLVTMSTGLALLVRASWTAAGRLDADAATAAELRAEAARLDATATARTEVDAVLHDRVLAALNVAVRSPSSPDIQMLARDALAALASFEDVPRGPDDARVVSGGDLAERLRSAVAVVAPWANVRDDVPAGCAVPEGVARALAEGTAEAVRNSVRHAGAPDRRARICVTLVGGRKAGLSEVVVTVDDDGAGFDPAAVPGDRLGIEVSMRGRLRAVQGTAEVDSRPGEGTRVVLSWADPRLHAMAGAAVGEPAAVAGAVP